MVDDENLVKTADLILAGEIITRGPALYSDMPATEYRVGSVPIFFSYPSVTNYRETESIRKYCRIDCNHCPWWI
jgi:hypothetical protein